MPKFLEETDRKAEKGKFKITRIKNNKEEVVIQVGDFGTALDIIFAFREVGPFRIYNDVPSVCHIGY